MDLYPKIEPYDRGMLDVGDGHRLYYEQSGNPQGIPVVFLHGGPGAGSNPAHRRFFDPDVYRIVIFDQRGAGRSRPFASVENNTTDHLVQDIESLRTHLNIQNWLVFGGSWGSTLALVYALRHTSRCRGLVLRGIFLGSNAELDWFLYGMRTVFPEAWRRFSENIPDAEQSDLLTAYHMRLVDPSPEVHMPAAAYWAGYETSCSNLLASPSEAPPQASSGALSLARIEAHFFINDVFIGDTEILDGVPGLRHLPCVVVQGRYDMVCPIRTADALVRAWPEIDYRIVPDAGHSAMEPGIRSQLVRATESMKDRI
ncbi:MAG: prolyl aminopeptidase [Rhodospirillales bacterium]|nr:prolyl aminopeptidase [Rhodospirillales bacterium]MBO6788637.1 prolyl aminopeptidase [Rhodospirillales bacterium]